MKTAKGKTIVILAAFAIASFAGTTAQADEIADLAGATVDKNANGFGAYKDKIIQNGTINLTASPGNATPGTYTIGTNATVNCAKEVQFNDDFNFNIVNGGMYVLTSGGALTGIHQTPPDSKL